MTEQPGDARAPRILVVDDDPPLLRMIQLTLLSEGFDVVVAQDGMAGLSALETQPFDLLVFDLQMPRLDGRAMYHALRERGHELPAMVLSAYGAEKARKELNVDAGLDKPFDVDLLIDTVRRLLECPPLSEAR